MAFPGCGLPLSTSALPVRSDLLGQGQLPAASGLIAGRQESRACRPCRLGREGPTRRVRRPCGLPPSRARGPSPYQATSRYRARCLPGLQLIRRRMAARWCQPSERLPHQPRRHRHLPQPAGLRAGHLRCRGCGGEREGQIGP